MARTAKTVSANLLFKAFADETRLRILHLLRTSELCVADIVTILGVPQPKISQQLAVLRGARLVEGRKDGLWHFYRLASADGKLHRKMIECLDCCFAEVPVLRADSRRADKLRRSGGCCPRTAARDVSRRKPAAA
jgi:ArsR family transcriptional regulator